MKRGDVYWIAFDPSVGGEIQKTRPAVIVSNDVANSLLNKTLVVPLSSKVEHLYPGEARVTLLGKASKAMADQLTTVSKLRFKRKIGSVSPEDLVKLEAALMVQLGLKR